MRFCSARCRGAAHYLAHADAVLQRTRAHYFANLEYYRAYAKAWFPRNRESQRAAFRKYRFKNLDLVRAKDHERRVLERRLRPLIDALIAACMGPLDHLVDFTDEHLAELQRLLSCDAEAFTVLQQGAVH